MDAKKLFSTRIDRRRMLGNLGMMGAGAVLTACGAAVAKPPQNTDYDAAILNFALNLEYLEAAFYLAATDQLSLLPGYTAEKVQLPSNYSPTPFQDAQVDEEFALELAAEELSHVKFLMAALQQAGAPVAELPVINLDSSFKAAAAAAFKGVNPVDVGLPAGFTPDQFDPFASAGFFLFGAFIFEDVGVTAYKGAAKYITNPDYLEAAAGILAAEAYHAGTIRTDLYAGDVRRRNVYNGIKTWDIAKAISDARDALDQDDDKDQGIQDDNPFNTQANISVTDKNGVAFSRTPLQVAKIVYLSPAAQPGGFFPNGITIPPALKADFDFLLSL